MTLLETLVAIVILGLTAVGFLDLFQGTARATHDADQWLRAAAVADAAMEEAKTNGATPAPGDQALAGGGTRRVERTLWRDGLDAVTVTVTLPGGAQYTIHRLLRTK